MFEWKTINDSQYATTKDGKKLRIVQANQGVYGAGRVACLELLTDIGWKWIDIAWYRSDGHATHHRTNKEMYPSFEEAAKKVAEVAEELFG